MKDAAKITQSLRDFNFLLKNKKLPPNAVVIELRDKDEKHLAFVACRHERQFSSPDADSDREQSLFLEEISDFEAAILDAYFRVDRETARRFGGWTGELIITGANSEIIHHERPARSDG